MAKAKGGWTYDQKPKTRSNPKTRNTKVKQVQKKGKVKTLKRTLKKTLKKKQK